MALSRQGALLWHRMVHEGDDQAREDLVIAYRPLVFWLAKRFQVRPSSWQDLIQEGMVALIEAVDTSSRNGISVSPPTVSTVSGDRW